MWPNTQKKKRFARATVLETLRDGTHAVKRRLTRIGDSFFRIYPAGSKSLDTRGPWYLDVAVLCEGRFTLIQTHTHIDTHTFRHTHMPAEDPRLRPCKHH